MPVPDADFDVFARFFDLDYGGFTEDLDLYRNFAAISGGPILDVGTGTGRVLLSLAAEGYRVVGVDVSPAMLRIAEAKLKASGLQAQFVRGDIRDLRLEERFHLAIVAADGLMHLSTLADQGQALQKLHDLLIPGGMLIVDLFHPHPERLLALDKELVLAWSKRDPQTGHMVSKLVSRETDFALQLQHITFFYDELDKQGHVTRVIAPFVLRYLGRYEMELLLQRHGFVVEHVYGSYELDDFTADSDRMIFQARRSEG